MKIQILKNYIGQIFKIQILKPYTQAIKREQLEQQYFQKLKKEDSLGTILTILPAIIFVILIVWGFLNLMSILGELNQVDEININPPVVFDAFYGYYGAVGSSSFVPIINLKSPDNISVNIVHSPIPVIKEFYLVKPMDPSIMSLVYELTQYMDYKYRIIDSSELDSVPEGSFVIYFGQVLDYKTYEVINSARNHLNFIFISKSIPENYRPIGQSPIKHNLFPFQIEQNIRIKHPVLGDGVRVNYRIPGSNINGMTSYFWDEGRRRFYIFFPEELNAIGYNLSQLYYAFRVDFETGLWSRTLRKTIPSVNLIDRQVMLPLSGERLGNTVIIYSTDPKNRFFISINLYPYSRGIILPKERIFLPKTEQIFDIRYNPYGIRNERRSLEIRLMNSSNSMVLPTIKIGNFEPRVNVEYRRSLDLSEGTYKIELWEADGVNLFSKTIITASDIYPTASYKESRSGREVVINFYSYDGTPLYLENIKYFLPWEDRMREERFVDTSGIVIPLNQPLQTGNYTIKIEIKGKTYEATFRVLPRTSIDRLIFGNPLGLFTIVVSVIVVVVSNYLRPKPPIKYSIDIPEVFPPVETIQIKLDEGYIIRAFETIENYYKWKNIPLTESEIAEGLKEIDIRLENAVIDTNSLSIVLNTLVMRGVLKKYKDYYIPTEWERNSGYTIEQLVMYRLIRDQGLERGIIYELDQNNRVNFTTEYGDGIIYLYEPNRVEEIVKSIAEQISDNKEIIILTKDYFDLQDLQSKLYYVNGGMLIINYIRNDRIQLYTVEDYLEKIKIIY
ncbi:MAG: hypothetical protein QXD88_01130 [Candidatus Anstonellales archaeon]